MDFMTSGGGGVGGDITALKRDDLRRALRASRASCASRRYFSVFSSRGGLRGASQSPLTAGLTDNKADAKADAKSGLGLAEPVTPARHTISRIGEFDVTVGMHGFAGCRFYSVKYVLDPPPKTGDASSEGVGSDQPSGSSEAHDGGVAGGEDTVVKEEGGNKEPTTAAKPSTALAGAGTGKPAKKERKQQQTTNWADMVFDFIENSGEKFFVPRNVNLTVEKSSDKDAEVYTVHCTYVHFNETGTLFWPVCMRIDRASRRLVENLQRYVSDERSALARLQTAEQLMAAAASDMGAGTADVDGVMTTSNFAPMLDQPLHFETVLPYKMPWDLGDGMDGSSLHFSHGPPPDIVPTTVAPSKLLVKSMSPSPSESSSDDEYEQMQQQQLEQQRQQEQQQMDSSALPILDSVTASGTRRGSTTSGSPAPTKRSRRETSPAAGNNRGGSRSGSAGLRGSDARSGSASGAASDAAPTGAGTRSSYHESMTKRRKSSGAAAFGSASPTSSQGTSPGGQSNGGTAMPGEAPATTTSSHSGGGRPAKVPKHVLQVKRGERSVGAAWRCDVCGAKDTPLKRRGPNGPGTLCNACGMKLIKGTMRLELID